MTMPPPPDWALVIPVKPLDRAKSRLAGLAGPRRGELALAMAADTVRALLASPAVAVVIVVTDDAAAGAELGALGAVVIPDRPAAGLNPALEFGAAYAAAAVAGPRPGGPGRRPARAAPGRDRRPRWPRPAAGRRRSCRTRPGPGTTLYTAGPGGGVPARVRARLGGPARGRRRGRTRPCRASRACGRTWTRRRTCSRAAALGLGPRTTAVAARLLTRR